LIHVEHVTRTYGRLVAVDDVSFSVGANEIVGFVGPNGAGKSTMLKMLSTYLEPTSGTIRVGDTDIDVDAVAVRQQIGYLPGDTPLYGDMVVIDWLRFVAGAHSLTGGAIDAAVTRVVDTCGVGPVIDKRIHQCSTGFRQRVGLASALIHDPPVLLLDEPTHGFDPLQVMAFRDLLHQLKQDRAILFSTHIIADVEAVSDRVLIIDHGRLLADGTLSHLCDEAGLADPSLERLFAHLVSEIGDAHV
jgi:ABC-2 type transport system ATP-binding protein